jgi:hypothetical protein
MIQCKVFINDKFYSNATLAASAHVGEYLWFNKDGEGRTTYKIEKIVHGANGDAVELHVSLVG